MKALISPNEVFESGIRVAQVEADDKVFPVAPPMFWIDCPEDVTPQWTYVDGDFIAPIPEPESNPVE